MDFGFYCETGNHWRVIVLVRSLCMMFERSQGVVASRKQQDQLGGVGKTLPRGDVD